MRTTRTTTKVVTTIARAHKGLPLSVSGFVCACLAVSLTSDDGVQAGVRVEAVFDEHPEGEAVVVEEMTSGYDDGELEGGVCLQRPDHRRQFGIVGPVARRHTGANWPE